MKRICLNRNQVFRGNLILVNKNHPIRKEGGITRIGFPESEEEMEWRAGEALLELLRAVDREEELALVSGFRRKTEQRKLYAESLRENGEEFTAKFVAMPGCSEHETGLAIDLGKKGGQIDLICPDFPYSGICQEFRKRAPEFGFVERYPEGKEAVTGIGREPWHFRYVGAPHAALMTKWKLVLEEYVRLLRDCGPEHLKVCMDGKRYEIYYQKCQGPETEVCVSEEQKVQVSGDNEAGFLITAWCSL